MIYNRTFMQSIVPEQLRGRVFTLSSALGSLGYPIGTTLAATSVTAIQAKHVAMLFCGFGGGTALLILLIWFSLIRYQSTSSIDF